MDFGKKSRNSRCMKNLPSSWCWCFPGCTALLCRRLCWCGCVSACRLGGNCMAACASTAHHTPASQSSAGLRPEDTYTDTLHSLISLHTLHTQWPLTTTVITCDLWGCEVKCPASGFLWCNDDVMMWSIYCSELSYISGCCQNIAVPYTPHHHTTTAPQHVFLTVMVNFAIMVWVGWGLQFALADVSQI